jgi:hypothetical protein
MFPPAIAVSDPQATSDPFFAIATACTAATETVR